MSPRFPGRRGLCRGLRPIVAMPVMLTGPTLRVHALAALPTLGSASGCTEQSGHGPGEQNDDGLQKLPNLASMTAQFVNRGLNRRTRADDTDEITNRVGRY